ncbi:MAG TPA: GNAT family N-acetyltransferase [Stellaceae bacterium]|jgi:GNAT superfamily N-acetyltransferase|nr:GNAT family N-acetyltransferase [Stellaceae bacterium]
MPDANAPIRLAIPEEAPAVASLVDRAYRHYIARIGRPPMPMLDDYPELVLRGAVWVVEDAGAIAGILVLLPQPDHLLLDNIAVSPDRQKTGLGRKLLAFAEAEALRRGYAEIRLLTNLKMVENQRLYASIGYEETERKLDAGFERVFMRKRLFDDPETVARKQLDAYNARDIDAFMACWADDAQVFEHPSTLLARGAADIRERHIARFKEPDLHGHLVHRIVIGDKIVDQEIVTRNFPEGVGRIDVVAIYQVERGKIAAAWFIFGARRPA